MNNKIKSVTAFLFGICFIAALGIFSIRTIAFQKDFYISFYEEENLAEELNVDEDVLNESILSLLEYIQSDRDEISDVFNSKEKAHMKDVRSLYNGAMHVMYGCIAYMILVLLMFSLKERRHMFSFLAKGLLQASMFFLMFSAILFMWAYTDFGDFWYRIHTLFFTNELWLLDPATDFMILICPENMFLNICLRFAGRFGVILLVSILWAVWYLFKRSDIGFDKN